MLWWMIIRRLWRHLERWSGAFVNSQSPKLIATNATHLLDVWQDFIFLLLLRVDLFHAHRPVETLKRLINYTQESKAPSLNINRRVEQWDDVEISEIVMNLLCWLEGGIIINFRCVVCESIQHGWSWWSLIVINEPFSRVSRGQQTSMKLFERFACERVCTMDETWNAACFLWLWTQLCN